MSSHSRAGVSDTRRDHREGNAGHHRRAAARNRRERHRRSRTRPVPRGRDEGQRHRRLRCARPQRCAGRRRSPTKTEYLLPRTLLAFDQYQDWLHVYLPDASQQLDRLGEGIRRDRLHSARVADPREPRRPSPLAVPQRRRRLRHRHRDRLLAVPHAHRHLLRHRSARSAQDAEPRLRSVRARPVRSLRRAHRVRRRRRPDRDPRHEQPGRHRSRRVARLCAHHQRRHRALVDAAARHAGHASSERRGRGTGVRTPGRRTDRPRPRRLRRPGPPRRARPRGPRSRSPRACRRARARRSRRCARP